MTSTRLEVAQLHGDVDALLLRHGTHASGDAPAAATAAAASEAASASASTAVIATTWRASAPAAVASAAAATAGHGPAAKGAGKGARVLASLSIVPASSTACASPYAMAVLEEIPDEADAGAAAPDACGGAAPCAAEERSGDAAPPGDADADAVFSR